MIVQGTTQDGRPIILVQSTQEDTYEIHSIAVLTLSISQIVLGFLTLVFNVVGLCFFFTTNVSGHAIWSGILVSILLVMLLS